MLLVSAAKNACMISQNVNPNGVAVAFSSGCPVGIVWPMSGSTDSD